MSLDLRLRVQHALREQYRIEDEVGRGGMAVVYRAQDLQASRTVALKVLLPGVAMHLGARRFAREIALAEDLDHPNIVPVLAAGDADDLPYYVMPFLEGASLREQLHPDTGLPFGRTAEVAAQVADALAYAHARAVIHRDIKPENILIAGERVVVMDFGVGKALNAAGGSSLTDTGFVVGTPTYMSPEQAAGDPEIDGRTDLYSLGIVLYELIGGVLPFKGETVQQVIASRFLSRPAPLREVRPDAPAPLAAIVDRLLAVRPADRIATADETARQLRAAIEAGA